MLLLTPLFYIFRMPPKPKLYRWSRKRLTMSDSITEIVEASCCCSAQVGNSGLIWKCSGLEHKDGGTALWSWGAALLIRRDLSQTAYATYT